MGGRSLLLYWEDQYRRKRWDGGKQEAGTKYLDKYLLQTDYQNMLKYVAFLSICSVPSNLNEIIESLN